MEINSSNINASGFIEADNHKIYWEDWGNANATPIFYMHGGPGGGVSESEKIIFDPKIHRVIFHDQRGSGRSTPFAEINNNTSQDLIADIELLREHLDVEKMYVMGGSWGSTLSLLYAISHPERVIKLLIYSLFLARKFEIDFVNEGYPKYFFPEAWKRFISLVPEENRKTGNDVMDYYAEKINSTDIEISNKYANEWILWETTLCSVVYNPQALEKEIIGHTEFVALAKIELHYFLNQCFIPENFILDNIQKIKHIPCYLLQGRFDMCTPPVSALDLKDSYGENLILQIVNSGHMPTDPEMETALKNAITEMK